MIFCACGNQIYRDDDSQVCGECQRMIDRHCWKEAEPMHPIKTCYVDAAAEEQMRIESPDWVAEEAEEIDRWKRGETKNSRSIKGA